MGPDHSPGTVTGLCASGILFSNVLLALLGAGPRPASLTIVAAPPGSTPCGLRGSKAPPLWPVQLRMPHPWAPSLNLADRILPLLIRLTKGSLLSRETRATGK